MFFFCNIVYVYVCKICEEREVWQLLVLVFMVSSESNR